MKTRNKVLATSAVSYRGTSATFPGSNGRDCGASDKASVDVIITEGEIRTASTDTNSDTLILIVSPI